jgi:hypothetical protein
MPNVDLKKWKVRNIQLNHECLTKGTNKLSVELQFSISIPPQNENCFVETKLKFSTESGAVYFSIDLVFVFVLNEASLTDDEKNDLLKNTGFPICYKQLCNCVKDILSVSNNPELPMPNYEDVEKTL